MPGDTDLLPTLLLDLRPERLAALVCQDVKQRVQREASRHLGSHQGCLTDQTIVEHLCTHMAEDPLVPASRSNHDLGSDSQTRFIRSFVVRHSATWVAVTLRRMLGYDSAAPQTQHLWINHRTSPYAPLACKLGVALATRLRALEDFLSPWSYPVTEDDPSLGLVLALSARGLEWRLQFTKTCTIFEPCWQALCHRPALLPGGPCDTHAAFDWLTESQTDGSLGLSHLSTTRQSHLMAFYGNFDNLSSSFSGKGQDFRRLFEAERKKSSQQEGASHHQSRQGASGRRLANTHGALEQAAAQLGYSSLETVAHLGLQHLKQRFRARAREVHPDCGGTSDEFQTTEKAYRDLLAEHWPTDGAA